MQEGLQYYKMENGQKEVSQLFDGRKIFCIPSYQRSYSWEEKQLKEFLEDLDNQLSDKNYFFGTILFQEDEREDDFEKINIVDGQQRLTTIIIFMKVLINYLEALEENTDILEGTYIKKYNKVKFRIQDSDNEFFQTYILGENENGKEAIKTPSQRRLLYAKNYFKKMLIQKMNNKGELNVLKSKIENSKLLTYSVLEEAEAALIFETTNDRGKPLTNLEKTKSFLMYKTYLASREKSPVDLLQRIFMRFSEIYRTLELIENKIDEDSILQYYFISYEKWDKKRDYQRYLIKIKEKINGMIASERYEDCVRYIETYTKKLKETFDTMSKILNQDSEPVRDLFLLQRISIFYPLLIKTYQLDETEDKNRFLKVAKLLEIFSFRVLSLKIKRINDVDASLSIIARNFKGNFEDLIEQLKNKIKELSPDNAVKGKLSSTTLYGDFNNNDLNYLFWKYENYLRTSGNAKYGKMSEQEFSEKDKKYKLTVEHIASQTPKVTTNETEFEEMTQEFKDYCLHNLGNLTFDPQSANSSKGNKSVPEKDNKYFKKAPFMTQNELGDYMEGSKWTKESIEKRRKKIIGFALERWNPDNVCLN